MYRKLLLSILFVFAFITFVDGQGIGPPPPPSKKLPLPGIGYLAIAGLYLGYKKISEKK